MSIKAIKHRDTRAHIPSKEEEGYEAGSEQVLENKEKYYERPSHWTRDRSPELIWKDKFGRDDWEKLLRVDIRSLYRHEHISPEVIIQRLFDERTVEGTQLTLMNFLVMHLKEMNLKSKKLITSIRLINGLIAWFKVIRYMLWHRCWSVKVWQVRCK